MRRRYIVRIKELIIEKLLFCCSLVSVFTTVGIILVLFFESIEFFKAVPILQFLTDTQWTPLFINKHFGILPLLCGTFLTTIIAIFVAIPIGLVSAIYLSEYASLRIRNIVKPFMEMLAAIPTVVYGYFALLFVTPLLKKIIPSLSGFNALSSGIVMGIMIIPMVSSLSEDALRAVPMGLREGGFGVGSTRLQVALRIVLPSAFSGITSAFILAVSRAIGETMIVAIASGMQPRLTLNPLVPIQTITSYIVQISLGDTPHGTLEYHTIFVCGMTLFIITFLLNAISFRLRRRFQEVYA